MPRRTGASTAPFEQIWKQGEDGTWTSSGTTTRGNFKGRVRFTTRKRRKQIGASKESNQSKRSN